MYWIKLEFISRKCNGKNWNLYPENVLEDYPSIGNTWSNTRLFMLQHFFIPPIFKYKTIVITNYEVQITKYKLWSTNYLRSTYTKYKYRAITKYDLFTFTITNTKIAPQIQYNTRTYILQQFSNKNKTKIYKKKEKGHKAPLLLIF